MKEAERFDTTGREGSVHYQRALADSQLSRLQRPALQSTVRAEDQEWEDSPQGRLKHLINEHMNTREFALDLYIQVLEPGEKSGVHRHFSEEILYVLEGEGYDLHWDPKFTVDVEYTWSWDEEPKRFEWKADDFIYIPPYVNHQHVATAGGRARLISATGRVIKALGFDGLEQVEATTS